MGGDRAAPDALNGVDLDKPSPARIYDFYLGGTHNWAVDREFGRAMLTRWPHAEHGSRHNRAFMNRVVRAALDAGIRQFIDLGSGIPTAGNVHEIVADQLPGGEPASVVYVDYEAVAAAHAQLILERENATTWAALIQRDLRAPTTVLDDPETQRLIDFDRPVCLLMIAVLHFAGPDDHPDELIATYRDVLAPGSWLALSHMTAPQEPDAAPGVQDFAEHYRDTANPVWLRDRDDIVSWFDGLTLLEPGITHLPDWRPTIDLTELPQAEAEARPFAWCGVGEKPH